MSSAFDLMITGGQVVTGQGIFPATLVAQEGRIVGVLDPSARPAAADHIAADGLCILPGVVDPHVHMRDPGRPEAEDFLSGTRAAAAGGITTVLEMPISEPPVNSGEVLARRAQVVQQRAMVDFALIGGAGHDNIEEIAGLAEAGAVAVKTFLQPPAPGREHEFVGLWCSDDGAMYDVMAAVAKVGLRHGFHCENYAMVERRMHQLKTAGKIDGLAHALSRPAVMEDAAVAAILAMAASVGGPVHVVHLSSPMAAQLVREARARGVDVTCETCPQYLLLTYEALKEHGPFAKCNPALRSPAEVEAFWPYLLDGTIDMVGSDHAPFLPEEKEKGLDDIFDAPPGMPGMETMLPLMLTAVHEGRLSLPQIARLHAERPAEVFRLFYKGRIGPGMDADLVMVDMSGEWRFDKARSFSKARDCMRVYQGRKMRGRVVSTLVRGVLVFHEGEITAQPGHGQFVRPGRQA